MKVPTPDLQMPAIAKRDAFATFMHSSGLNDIISRNMMDIINHRSETLRTFIGGSRAWMVWSQSALPSASLTPAERSALTAGNTDIFMITPDLKECEVIACAFYRNVALKIKQECDAVLEKYGYTVDLRVDGLEISPVKKSCKPKKLATYTMFPSFAFRFILDDGKNKVTLRSKAAEEKKDLPFGKKLMLYVEMGHVPNVNIGIFQKQYLRELNGWNYLNEDALITFAMMISQNRSSEKGLDVDTIRRELFFRAMAATGKSMSQVYDDVASKYVSVFGHSPLFSETYVNRIQLEALKTRDLHIDALCDTFESWLVERLRPSINAFVQETSQEIVDKTNGSAFMFIVGGDAMRRYKRNISVTKDIDTKVYVSSVKDENTVRKIVIDQMSKLVTYLITNKRRLLEVNGTDNIGTGVVDGMHANIKFLTNNIKNVQFRLRHIKRSSDTLPVTLFSIDYRGYLRGIYGGRKFNLQYDVPIVDVAIQDNANGTSMSEIVTDVNGLPIASMKFLLKDLLHTYEDEKLTTMRIWARKRNKDVARFNELRRIYMHNPSYKSGSSAGELYGTKIKLNAVDPIYKMFNDKIISDYKRMFEDIRLHKKKLHSKHKMPFDGSTFDFPIAGKLDKTTEYHDDIINLSMRSSRSDRMSID
jgi:hypothetical protein